MSGPDRRNKPAEIATPHSRHRTCSLRNESTQARLFSIQNTSAHRQKAGDAQQIAEQSTVAFSFCVKSDVQLLEWSGAKKREAGPDV
jgi:hypothetical protein